MAISVTTDLATVSLCESTADGGTHYRLSGTSSANPAADADAMVQSTACLANKCGSTVSTDVGGHFNHATTFDLTNKNLYFWRQIVTPGNMLTKANQGITLGLTNTSTTSTAAWSTTNYKKWFMDGSDTMPITPGWLPYCLDPTQTADASAGTLTLSTVKNIGFICRQGSGITTTVSNQFYDAIRMGTGVTLTASSGADVANMESIYTQDNLIANRWGVLTKQAGIYYGAGKLNVGATAQTNACTFTDSDQVLIWRKNKVANAFYEFNLKGAAGFKTTMTLTSMVIRGEQAQKWNINCDANGYWKSYGCAMSDLNAVVLSSGSVLSGGSIGTSGTIEANGAAITGVSFTGHTANQIKFDSAAEVSQMSSCSFTKGAATAHAIELFGTGTGATWNVTLSSITLSGYAAVNGSTGNEAVYVNLPAGNTVNITVSGGTEPKYRTAGATVNVILGQCTLTLTAQVSLVGAEIRIYDNDAGAGNFGTELTGTESNPTSNYVYSGSQGNSVIIQVMLNDYVEYSQQYTLPATTTAALAVTLTSETNT